MRNKIRIIGVSLASMAALLLVSGVAWAQALKTEIEGFTENCFYLGEPERYWVDEDGIRHVRGQRWECDWVGDVHGRLPRRGASGVANWDYDIAGETRFEHGTTSFYGKILLPGLVSATGNYTYECTGPSGMQTCNLECVWHVEDGRLLMATQNWVQGDGDPTMPYTGFLLDPPGLGPVKRNRPRTR